MYKTLTIAAALTFSAVAANAAILDFETGFSGDETPIVGNEFVGGFDVTFSSPNGLSIVEVGGNTDGFVPNDTPNPPDAFGDYFLTSDFGTVTSLTINYGTAVAAASFDVADIDGSGNDLEVFTFIARDTGGNVLDTQVVDGNNPLAGDAAVTRIGFSGLAGLISEIEISGTTAGGTRFIGIAFDNFDTMADTTSPIPLPAGAPLALLGLGALGALRARRKA